MYIYLISAPDYDWTAEYHLTHTKRWQVRDVEAHVFAAIAQLCESRGAKYYEWGGAIESVVDELCTRYGYKRLKYQVQFSVVHYCGAPDYPGQFKGSGKRAQAQYQRLEQAIRQPDGIGATQELGE